MRRLPIRTLLALALGLATAAPITTAGTAAAATGPAPLATAELGVAFTADADPGQCIGPRQQWAPSPEWSASIQLDTDQRRGGCRLAFGIRDLTGGLAGLTVSYTWEAAPGADGTQCGDQGVYNMPVTQVPAFGTGIGVDTDQRHGGCLLTFSLSGRDDVALDVRYWADGNPTQCLYALPQGQWRTVLPGAPVTIGDDTDQRVGGCHLSLRLRQF